MESNNEINISINVSDDLLKKMMSLMVSMSQPPTMGIPAAMLGALAGPPPSAPKEDKTPIGFRPPETANNKEKQ